MKLRNCNKNCCNLKTAETVYLCINKLEFLIIKSVYYRIILYTAFKTKTKKVLNTITKFMLFQEHNLLQDICLCTFQRASSSFPFVSCNKPNIVIFLLLKVEHRILFLQYMFWHCRINITKNFSPSRFGSLLSSSKSFENIFFRFVQPLFFTLFVPVTLFC